MDRRLDCIENMMIMESWCGWVITRMIRDIVN